MLCIIFEIQDEDRVAVLTKIKEGKLTFSEAASDIKVMKQLHPVRNCFVKEMGLTTWKEAEKTYPEYSERVREFIGTSIGKPF